RSDFKLVVKKDIQPNRVRRTVTWISPELYPASIVCPSGFQFVLQTQPHFNMRTDMTAKLGPPVLLLLLWVSVVSPFPLDATENDQSAEDASPTSEVTYYTDDAQLSALSTSSLDTARASGTEAAEPKGTPGTINAGPTLESLILAIQTTQADEEKVEDETEEIDDNNNDDVEDTKKVNNGQDIEDTNTPNNNNSKVDIEDESNAGDINSKADDNDENKIKENVDDNDESVEETTAADVPEMTDAGETSPAPGNDLKTIANTQAKDAHPSDAVNEDGETSASDDGNDQPPSEGENIIDEEKLEPTDDENNVDDENDKEQSTFKSGIDSEDPRREENDSTFDVDANSDEDDKEEDKEVPVGLTTTADVIEGATVPSVQDGPLSTPADAQEMTSELILQLLPGTTEAIKADSTEVKDEEEGEGQTELPSVGRVVEDEDSAEDKEAAADDESDREETTEITTQLTDSNDEDSAEEKESEDVDEIPDDSDKALSVQPRSDDPVDLEKEEEVDEKSDEQETTTKKDVEDEEGEGNVGAVVGSDEEEEEENDEDEDDSKSSETPKVIDLEEAERQWKEENPEEEDEGSGSVHDELPTSDLSESNEPHSDHGDVKGHDQGHGSSHHGDTPEDKESKKRTAIIVGVAVGGVALFTLAFFASRQCKQKAEFTPLQKKKTQSEPETIEFHPVGQAGTALLDDEAKNGLYRHGPRMGPPSPRFHRKAEGKFQFPDGHNSGDKLSPNASPAITPLLGEKPAENGKRDNPKLKLSISPEGGVKNGDPPSQASSASSNSAPAPKGDGLYRNGPRMGPPSPRMHRKTEGKFAFPAGGASPDPSSPDGSSPGTSGNYTEPLINGVEQLKYIDESTEDEKDALLPSKSHDPNPANVEEETQPASPSISAQAPPTNPSADANDSSTHNGSASM
ncbi:dynein heavy chain-like protein pf11_0240, partial [Plakobranchus ocellatus]